MQNPKSGEPFENSAARQIALKRGCGKIRRLDGKLLWIQSRRDIGFLHISTQLNVTDLVTKPLSGNRMKVLMNYIGFANGDTGDRVGETERERSEEKSDVARRIQTMAKWLMRLVAVEGLEHAAAEMQFDDAETCSADVVITREQVEIRWRTVIALVALVIFVMVLISWLVVRRLTAADRSFLSAVERFLEDQFLRNERQEAVNQEMALRLMGFSWGNYQVFVENQTAEIRGL